MKITVQGKTVTVDDSFRKLAPEEQERVVEEIAASIASSSEKREPTTSTLGAFGRGAADMGSFGFDDEIVAGAKSLLGNDYDEEVERLRQGKETAREEHPWAYTGGQVVGGIGSSLAIPGANIARAATLPGMMLRGAAGGAAAGQAYGMGSAEGDIVERAQEGVGDALAGGVAGVVAPPLLRGAGAVLRGTGRVARTAGHRVAPGLVRSNAGRDAAKYVATSLKESAGSVEDAISEARRLNVPVGMGGVSTRARTASEINRSSGSVKGEVYDELDDLLNEKKRNIGFEMQQGMDGPAGNAYTFRDRYIAGVKGPANDAYNKIWAKRGAPGPRSAAVTGALWNQSKELRSMVKSALPPGVKLDKGSMTLEHAEITRRALKELGGGSDAKAAYYRNQAKVLTEALDKEHKDLAGVRKIWGDTYSMNEGFDAGTRGIKRNSQVIENEFLNTPDVAKPLYKKGMYSDIVHQLDDTAENSVGAVKRFTHTPGGARVLDLLTDGNSGRARHAIDEFEAVADVDTAVRRGSHTARLAEQNAMAHVRPVSFAGWAMQNIAQGNWGGAVSHLAAAVGYLPKAMKGLSPETQAEVIRLMTSRNRPQVERILRAFDSGTQAEKELFKKQFENLATQAVKSLAVAAETD